MGSVVRGPKAYPAYFGRVRRSSPGARLFSRISNLFPVGRQQEAAAKQIGPIRKMLSGQRGGSIESWRASDDKTYLWSVNVEEGVLSCLSPVVGSK